MLTETMISAIKRKNMKDVLSELLLIDGNEEGAKLVSDAGRLTEALMKKAGVYEEVVAEEPCCEPEEPCCEPEETEETDEDPFRLLELDTLIAKGKKKKAKKLLKEIQATGLKGSELDKRKTAIKGL